MNEMDKNTVETGVVKAEENAFELRSRSKLAGTEADQHDMRVLGKTQQLNVSEFPGCALGRSMPLTLFSEISASSLFSDSLYGDEHMGDHTCVSAPSPVQASIQES
jgi:hypothetical protein